MSTRNVPGCAVAVPCVNSFNPHCNYEGVPLLSHSTDEESDSTERLSGLPKVTQLEVMLWSKPLDGAGQTLQAVKVGAGAETPALDLVPFTAVIHGRLLCLSEPQSFACKAEKMIVPTS